MLINIMNHINEDFERFHENLFSIIKYFRMQIQLNKLNLN